MPPSFRSNSLSDELPQRDVALRELLRRQLRAVVLLVVRIVACALLITLLKPLWQRLPLLENLLFVLGALLCGVPLLREVGKNWRWRIALGVAYRRAERLADAEALLAPLKGTQAQLFDPGGLGSQTLAEIKSLRQEHREP